MRPGSRTHRRSGPGTPPGRGAGRVGGPLLVGLVASLLVVGAMTASPREGPGESTALCVLQGTYTITPGITGDTRMHHLDTEGPTGEVDCHGTVRGHEVTGVGTLADAGDFEGNALQGSGTSTAELRIPTSGGVVTIVLDGSYTYVPGGGSKDYESRRGDSLTGVFEFYPTEGDGLTTPITELYVVIEATLTS